MIALGRVLHHATMASVLHLIFEHGLSGMGRVGTMACPVIHYDRRCVAMQRTGTGNKKQDVIISYDGVEAVKEAWTHGKGAFINGTGTVTIC